MPHVWPSHAPRRSAMLCWAPRGSGPMDRVSAYPRYPCGPSPPPPGRAVSMTAASCGDDANLRPCGARCIRKVSGDAQRHCQCCLVGSNERRHPVVPPGVHAGCWVPLCLSSSGMPVLCAPFPHGYTGCQGFPTERPRSWGSIRAMACPVPPWCDLSAAACYGGRCPSVPRGSGCSRRTCLKGDAPTRCSCEPRLHPLRRSSVTPWYRQVGVCHRCRPDRRPAGTRLRGSGALGMPTPRREDALVPRRCPPQRKYTICRDGVRQRCRDSCCVCCVRARATYRCADADGAYVCGASRVLSIGGVSRGPPVAGYDSSDR